MNIEQGLRANYKGKVLARALRARIGKINHDESWSGLVSAFRWGLTKEGHLYWSAIHANKPNPDKYLPEGYVDVDDEPTKGEENQPSCLVAVRRSFSLEDLKKAFEAGDELVNQDWHEQEFCYGERCRCKGVRLKYSNFDEWVSQNYR